MRRHLAVGAMVLALPLLAQCPAGPSSPVGCRVAAQSQYGAAVRCDTGRFNGTVQFRAVVQYTTSLGHPGVAYGPWMTPSSTTNSVAVIPAAETDRGARLDFARWATR